MKQITTPISDEEILSLNVGDQISISGVIFTGRDAALPQLVELIKEDKRDFDLKGSAIMHTVVNNAEITAISTLHRLLHLFHYF